MIIIPVKKQRSRLVGGLRDGIPVVECFLCNNLLEVKQSSKGKPYFVCPSCLVRSFVNGDQGISRLNQVVHEGVLGNGH